MAPSFAWKYFKINPKDNSVCICNLCATIISRGGKTAKTFTTTNMMNHLKKFHPGEMTKKSEASDKLKRTYAECFGTISTIEPPSKVQPTIEAALTNKKLWDINDNRAKEIHYLIGEMIAIDIQPYSLISDIGFQRLLRKICPNYNIPSRKYFTNTIIPDIFQKVKAKLQISLDKATNISLTTDIWTASTNNSPFLSITSHWLSNDFEQHRAILRILPFPGHHTGVRISEELNNALDEYKLPKSKVFLVLRDSGTNMVAGITNSGFQAHSCFIHTLQLSLNDSIFAQQAIRTIVSINRNIVKHFNHSALAVNKLMEIQEQLNLKKHKLIQDVSTRWNSTYYMLERNLEQRKALVTYAVDNNIPTLSPCQWDLVQKIVELLRPFEEITKEASKRESTTSMIIPTILTLTLFLTRSVQKDKFSGIFTTIEELKSSIEKRFSNDLENKSLCLSTFLDPRFKMAFLKMDIKNKIKEWALEALEQCQLDSLDISTGYTSSSSTEDQDTAENTVTFSSLFNELASAMTDSVQNEGTERMSPSVSFKKKNPPKKKKHIQCGTKELNHYLNLPLLPREDSPFLWWNKMQDQLPLLSRLALKYLCAPASSVESERVFSTGGNLYEPTRNRLCPENGEILMFLHYNLRVFNFDYFL